jgi:predicted MFS family arabinose efflux permease
MAGLLTLLIAHILLATTGRVSTVLAGVAGWGVHMGLTQGVLSALIADRASPALRGAALGLYAPANGVALLVVGTRGGLLWERGGSRAPFWLGAAASVAALLLVRRLAGSDQD